MKRNIVVTEFAKRHFDSKFAGTKILDFTPESFENFLNEKFNDDFQLIEGYAPFCKHFFLHNFTNAKCGVVEITSQNYKFLQTGYNSRRDSELMILSRWFDSKDIAVSQAKYLDVILYSKEQLHKEGDMIECDWGVVSINGVPTPEESPIPPITMMRNALGIEEGGSGVPIDRKAYDKSVAYWSQYALVL